MGRNKGKIEVLLCVVLLSATLLFLFSLFKNISFPLLWNDEAETAMHTKRVLEYGYPKVYDGKNVVYALYHSDLTLGVDQRTDAYLVVGWTQFYYLAPFVYLSSFFDDLYVKTAILRSAFALAGFFGIVILAWSVSSLLSNYKKKIVWLIFFTLLETFSVSLVLHLREVRYYSLVILFSSIIIWLYVRRHIQNNISIKKYSIGLILSLFLLFNTYYPAFVILLICLFADELFRWKQDKLMPGRALLRITLDSMPLIISCLTVLPLVFFFKIPLLSQVSTSQFFFTFTQYLENIFRIIGFFGKYEFLTVAVLLRVLVAILASTVGSWPDQKSMKAANFLTLLFVIYVLIVARIPYYVFERYFILLQPVLAAVILLDIANLIGILNVLKVDFKKSRLIMVLAIPLILSTAVGSRGKIESLKGHWYELFHRYRGPLDYVIPHIQERVQRTDNLVIATNYEETAYMYYLGSKVIVGFVGNNIEQDKGVTAPDIVIFRKAYSNHYPRLFNDYLSQANYQKISFPVYDYNVNNIPEFTNPLHHLYKTKIASRPEEAVDIYIKEGVQ